VVTSTTTTLPAEGTLQLLVKPWAEVSLDDKPVGTTPLPPLTLAAGEHVVRLVRPAYQPIRRKLRIQPGQTTRLEVDFQWDGVPVPRE
jgi:hypothetical protein